MAEPQLFTSARNARDRFLRPGTLNQAGKTPFEVIDDAGLVQVRYYPALEEDSIELGNGAIPVEKTPGRTPLVIVPPLAVNMLIYDLFPNRSLVKFLRAKGFELYLIDWGRPDRRHDDYRLATYFADMLPEKLERIREHAGTRRLFLHGWSFGALFSYCYAALTKDPDIAGLVLVGAPVDYHRNGQLGKQYQRLSRQGKWLRKRTGVNVRRMPRRLFRSPGWANALAFKLINPVGTMQGYRDLLANLGDRDFVRDHATNAAFLEDMVAYPGGIIQDIIHYLWVDNIMAHNRLPMRDSDARLSDITAPVLNIVGRNDTIVTPQCSERMFDYIASEDTKFVHVPGGHMGILGGSKAPEASWKLIAEWMSERGSA